jgi:3',5'-cyclic AMP phosphodiesterase CpdA
MWIADKKFLKDLSRGNVNVFTETAAPPRAPDFRVLVLSDIHLEPPRLEGDITKRIATSVATFLKTAMESVVAVGNIRNYDFLINCGDILNAGMAAQYVGKKLGAKRLPDRIVACYRILYRNFALAALRKIQTTYGIPRNNLLSIPGNHDVYRCGKVQFDKSAEIERYRPYYDAFAVEIAANKVSYGAAWGRPCVFATKVVRKEAGKTVGTLAYLAFIGLDSNFEEYNRKFIENYGQVHPEYAEMVERDIIPHLAREASDAPLYLFGVVHHHLLPISNPKITAEDSDGVKELQKSGRLEGSCKKSPSTVCGANFLIAQNVVSTTTNAAFLIEFFQRNRMSLVLHGHMHENAIQEISYTPFKQAGAARTITVLACPSFAGGTDFAGLKGIVNLSLDLQAGTIQIDATSAPAEAKDWGTPVQVTRPLVSASRITPAENRLYFAMKKYLKQHLNLKSATTAQKAEIRRFEKYVDENMKEHGYVPICGKDGQRLAFLAPERYTRYYLLLLLREGIEPSILLNRHLPLRLSQLADWDTLLVPAFRSIHELLQRLREDLIRQHQEIAIQSVVAQKIAQNIRELGELIESEHVEGQDAEMNLVRFVAAKRFVKFSPTEAVPTEYEYTLVTFEPLIAADAAVAGAESVGGADAKIETAYRTIRGFLDGLPRITVGSYPTVGNTVPIESIGPSGTGLRWDPASMGNPELSHSLPPGAVWFPVRKPSEGGDPHWKRCPSIVARNADVMTWIDEVLANLTTGRPTFPPEIQLGKWNRGAAAPEIREPLPFEQSDSVTTRAKIRENEFARSTVEALRLVRYEKTFDLARQLAYAAPLEIKRVLLRKSTPDRYGRMVIEVVEADASKAIDEQPDAVSLGILRPVQRYVLGAGLKRAGEANAKILDKLKDPWGFARVNIPGSIADFSVTPPIVEELAPDEWEGDGTLKEFILCDGNHRVVQRVWQEGKPIQAVAICGRLPQPFYARPFSKFEWHITAENVLPSPPDTASKYAARQMDKKTRSGLSKTATDIIDRRPANESYRRYFRDLETGFGYLGGQGGRLA